MVGIIITSVFHVSIGLIPWNFYIAGYLGLGSIAWAGHVLHISHHISWCLSSGLLPSLVPSPESFFSSTLWFHLSLYTHHRWIGGLFIVGAGAHAGLFMVYDYQRQAGAIQDRILGHKHSLIVHLNWASVFLGCHSFGLYIHNDTLCALGRTSAMFSDQTSHVLTPYFGQWVRLYYSCNCLNPLLLEEPKFGMGNWTAE